MLKKNKKFFIFIFSLIGISIIIGIKTRVSYVGEMCLVDFLRESQDNIVTQLDMYNPYLDIYFDNEIVNLDELEEKSDLIVKVKTSPERKMFSQGIRTKVTVEELYKSDYVQERDEIYIAEPSYMDNTNKSYMSLGGYNIMECNEEYILFLKYLDIPEGYKYKDNEKITFMPVSTLYSKYSLKNTDIKVFNEEAFAENDINYYDIKDNDILVTSYEILNNYNMIKNEILQKLASKAP